jgi:hypothetical protein
MVPKVGRAPPTVYGLRGIPITVDTYGHLIPGANRHAVNRLTAMVEQSATYTQPDKKTGLAESANPAKRLVGHEGFDLSTS